MIAKNQFFHLRLKHGQFFSIQLYCHDYSYHARDINDTQTACEV